MNPADLKDEVGAWAQRLGVRPRQILIQAMTKKWASCSPRGRLCFNKDLIHEGIGFRHVVIVHELVHLIVPNHGRLFKSLMRAYLPGWERHAKGQMPGTCRGSRLLAEPA